MNENFSNKYQPIQWFIIAISIAVSIVILSTKEQESLIFLNYVNLFSLLATLIMLTLILYKLTLTTQDIIVTDREKHARHFYITFWVLVVIILPIAFLYSYYYSISDKMNNFFGVLALALALSTDAISEKILAVKFQKDKKKYKARY
ncbi:hypothetical protein [Paenibacillus xylanexedens]|uniref:hypothetical protein n=1 Tax=Paenibacillus xylanexedens TaxID=528191 RepID=UPI0011A949AD|nr:hypothetical protein [Paenibacillus xylanexedens]